MKSVSSLAIATCLLSVLPVCAEQKKGVELWLTTPDRLSLFAQQSTRLPFKKTVPAGQLIEVDDAQSFQSIDGFGFALTGGSAQLMMRMDPSERAALIKELFATGKDGIGVSYLRVSIGSSDMNDHVFSYDDLPAGKTDESLDNFDLGPDRTDVIPILKEILTTNPKIEILGSPWSAPTWMKTNGKAKGGSLRPEYYVAYAQYLVKYIQGMKAEGIPVNAITVQNEPLNAKNTPSLVMSAQEEDTFITQALGPAFRKAGITTKIVLYDHNCDVPEYPLTILNDPEIGQYVDGSGFHLYAGTISAMTKVHDAFPNKNLYFTEQMVVDRPGSTEMRISSPVQRVLIGATRNWSRNVLLWNLAADPQNRPHTDDGGCPVCQGAITLDGNKVQRNIAYYAIAHASKFIRPGSVRIASNLPEGLPNVAFKTPDGKKILIVANPGHSTQTFAIRFHGKSASASLSAGSVATYVW